MELANLRMAVRLIMCSIFGFDLLGRCGLGLLYRIDSFLVSFENLYYTDYYLNNN